MELDWTNIVVIAIIIAVTIIILIAFCFWLRRDNEEQEYRNELECRRQGLYMVQDPTSQGVWEVWSVDETSREMQHLSPDGNNASHSPEINSFNFYKARRVSNPRAKRIGSSKLEAILE